MAVIGREDGIKEGGTKDGEELHSYAPRSTSAEREGVIEWDPEYKEINQIMNGVYVCFYLPSPLDDKASTTHLLHLQLRIGVNDLDNICLGIVQSFPNASEVYMTGFSIPHDRLPIDFVFIN